MKLCKDIIINVAPEDVDPQLGNLNLREDGNVYITCNNQGRLDDYMKKIYNSAIFNAFDNGVSLEIVELDCDFKKKANYKNKEEWWANIPSNSLELEKKLNQLADLIRWRNIYFKNNGFADWVDATEKENIYYSPFLVFIYGYKDNDNVVKNFINKNIKESNKAGFYFVVGTTDEDSIETMKLFDNRPNLHIMTIEEFEKQNKKEKHVQRI